MSEQAQPRRGNRQQPVNPEGEAPAPAPPSGVATLIAEMRAEFQAQLACLEERHQESNARLLSRIQEKEAQHFLREQAQGAPPPPPPPPAVALPNGRPDVRVPDFPALDQDPEKAPMLPGITLRTSLRLLAAPRALRKIRCDRMWTTSRRPSPTPPLYGGSLSVIAWRQPVVVLSPALRLLLPALSHHSTHLTLRRPPSTFRGP